MGKRQGGLLRVVHNNTTVEPTPERAKLEVVQQWQGRELEDELLEEEEVMMILKVKKQWLRDHTTRVLPIVPHVRMGRQISYPKRAIFAWIAAQTETRPTWERKTGTA
jgi:hypothetical protein